MGRRGRLNLKEERFYFVTITVVRYINIFSYSPFCDILIENIKHIEKDINLISKVI